MKIAHIILAHKDPQHITRLSRLLSTFSDVYIHIDSLCDIDEYKKNLKDKTNVYFAEERYHCSWAGYNAVEAEIVLLKMAAEKKYDRYTFLQGADYPIKPINEIIHFYENHKSINFNRACCCTNNKKSYFYSRCRYHLFYNNRNIVKQCANILTKCLHLKLRDGYIHEEDGNYKVFWGTAQWSYTHDCVKYIIDFHKNHKKFNKWFHTAFAVDEMYFASIVMNSDFKRTTLMGGDEPAKKRLVSWRNLHYFEYIRLHIKIHTLEDFPFIQNLNDLYLRKVTTEESTPLLDKLDENCNFIYD